ncbi:MAG: alpha-2-macroglobulin [Candidatus Binatia bacterium]
MSSWFADTKNLVITALLLAVVILLGLLIFGRQPPEAGARKEHPTREDVAVIDVAFDRNNQRALNVIFDRPLGEKQVGEILGQDPAILKPSVGGSWRWQGANILRFEATDRFAMATEYRLALIIERIIKSNYTFTGKSEFVLQTEAFKVERIDISEEPVLEGKHHVLIRGNARFNTVVNPEVLATKLRLIDPLRGENDPIPVDLETTYRSQVIGFRSQPIEKHKEPRKLKLVILSNLTPEGGNVTLATDWVQTIPLGSSEKLTVLGISPQAGDPDSTVRLRFSSPVNPEAVGTYLSLTPAAQYRLSAEGTELILTGALIPGHAYELTVTQGLPARDEAKLQQDYKTSFTMPDLEPSFAFESPGMFLSASGSRTIALKSVNIGEVQLTIDRVYRNNLFVFFQYNGGGYEDLEFYDSSVAHYLGDRIVTQSLPLRNERNVSTTTPLPLENYVREQEPGLYRINIVRPNSSRGISRWLLMTDLGIVAKQGKDEFLVWVSSFANLSAVEGANVRLLSDQNQLIAEGHTDAEGLWRAQNLAKRFEKQTPYMVIVEQGNDFSFLLLDQALIDTSGFEVSGAEVSKEGYSAYVYGERDIYRPGETVEGVSVVRDRNLQPPPVMPLVLRHRDPEGNIRDTLKLTMTERGLAPFTLPVPAYAPTGHHTLELLIGEEVIGQYRFQVEDFVPDRIKVEIAPQKEEVSTGQELAYDVASAYLFGPPAASLTVESRVRVIPATFSPKGYDEFIFHDPERQFSNQEILTSEGVLDETGRRTFSATVPTGLRVPSSLTAVITARVQEQGGRGVTALQRIPVHPYPYYVGLRRLGEGYAEPRKPVTLEYVTVAPNASAVPAQNLRAELFRDRWHTVLRKTDAGNYRYESTREIVLVDSQTVNAGTTRGQFTFTPAEFGEYRVALTDVDTGSSTQVTFFVSGWGFSPWAIKTPGRLDLSVDKTEYHPGEDATVVIKAPFAGKLFLTVEREGIFHRQIHSLSGNTATITVPILADYRPNAYVTATLIRSASDLEPGTAGRAFGAVQLNVDQTSNRLKVDIAAPEEIRPLSTLTLQVTAAPNVDLTVAAVDEGILQLIAQQTPDPFAYFYRKLALAVRSFDIFSLLLPEVKVTGKAPVGGDAEGDAMEAAVRTESIRRVRPVAFWSGIVTTDGEGKATVSFAIPEFQGAVRVMAVAHQGKQFGSASHTTKVRTPVVLLPTFPRFLSFNDRVQLPVTVRNDTGKDGDFTATLTVAGPVTIEGESSKKVTVPHGREQTTYFTLKSGDVAGDVKLVLTGKGNNETTTASSELSLRADLPARTVEHAGTLAKAVTELPTDNLDMFRPETLRRELRIGPLPLVQFSGKLRYLLHYPYGCVEQTTSSMFPLVYFSDLAKELDPELFSHSDPTVFVQEGIRRLATMQLHDGGFAMWPDTDTLHPWGSIYASHFLVEARRAGHLVENFLYDRALEFLARESKPSQQPNEEELQRVTYALYVLARAGKGDLGTLDFVREHHSKTLKPESRALLGAAYAATGNTQVIEELTRGLEDAEQIVRQTGGNFNSTIRNRAMLLLAFLDAAPHDPRVVKLVQRLSRDAETGYWSTQESAFAFVALGQFFQQQAQKKPYTGKVFVGNTEIGAFTNTTTTFTNIPGKTPIRIEMDVGYESGAAFYALQSRGIPTDNKFTPEQAGLEIKRSFFTRNGGELDLATVSQGDLLVMKTQVRSSSGKVDNVVVQNLLPPGLEVENPRLKSTETLPWVNDANLEPAHQDIRDDRVLFFTDLPDNTWQRTYTLLRAVTPGAFRLPPAQAEAMYDPAIRATGERGTITITIRK